MLKQADDFYEESKDILYILNNISEEKLNTPTQFKSWSFTDIIRHLHVWNIASYKSLESENEWEKFNNELQIFFKDGKKLSDFEKGFVETQKLKYKTWLKDNISDFKEINFTDIGKMIYDEFFDYIESI